MEVSKRNLLSLVLVFSLNAYECCNILHYSSVCAEEHINVIITFENLFDGTVFANGYIGNPNCSSPNMEVSRSKTVALNIPFLQCNTIIEQIEDTDHLQATNTITIQFHPLIKSVLDCEIEVECDIDYPLRDDFFRSYFNRNATLTTTVGSKLDIMSGEKLFGDVVAGMLEASTKQFIVINITDGGKYEQVRIRKCYAHAKDVIDQISDPDILLDDDKCSKDGIINWLTLKADKSYSDLRDFSEIKNFDVSFTQKFFYITCGFNLCLESCTYSCLGDVKVKNSTWAFVQTYQVESFKGFKNRNNDLRRSVKMLYDRLLKLKDQQNVLKSIAISEHKTLGLEAMGQMTKNNDSAIFQEENIESKAITLDEDIPTVYMANSSENKSLENRKQNFNFSQSLNGEIKLDVTKRRESERFGKRSILDDEIEFSINTIENITSDSSKVITDDILEKSENSSSENDCFNSSCKLEKKANESEKFERHMTGTDCLNTCNSDKDIENIQVSTDLVTISISIDGSLQFYGNNLTVDVVNISDSNNTTVDVANVFNGNSFASDDGNFKIIKDNLVDKDCVPYSKYLYVTLLLCLLCVCFFITALFFILLNRKEKKKHVLPSNLLYNEF